MIINEMVLIAWCLSSEWMLCKALSNNLALTPPMGWTSWGRFRCNTNCWLYPKECISEWLLRDMAQRMVEDGYLAAGYQYVLVDDCWLATSRDSCGRLQPDPERFPSGIRNLSNYVHSLGLKFGIYEDYGMKTCEGYPGILSSTMQLDAITFAEWEVDYIKIDGCYSEPLDMIEGYARLGSFLLSTGRPMVYSCSWPAYQMDIGISPNYTAATLICNLWRNYKDIQDSWHSVRTIISHYAEHQEEFAGYAGPGHWNDPDMLIIGNFGLSFHQARVQMAIWAILAAPLIMSNDLRAISPEFRSILLNPKLIKINQDPLGIQGKRIYLNKKKRYEVWTKPVLPTNCGRYSWAIAILNLDDDGEPKLIAFPMKYTRLRYEIERYDLYDLLDEDYEVRVSSRGQLIARIPPLDFPKVSNLTLELGTAKPFGAALKKAGGTANVTGKWCATGNGEVGMSYVVLTALLGLSYVRLTFGLNNGLALTPPMGWMSWERFRCITDCEKYPDECISEKLIREMADRMAEDGYLSAGYEYLIIDDCWLAENRDSSGRLQPDPERFPSGMKNLSDYIHSKGLKFGIYEDYGTKTCAGYPGIINHLKEDAQLFASWDVDYTKIDGCYAQPLDMDDGYTEFGRHLLETKRPMVYSCSWPVYQESGGISPNYTLIAEHCNLWRNYGDIQDSWSSVTSIIDYFGSHQANFVQHAGPGHWNDPDMLIIGNYGLSYYQAKAQMAIWSVMAAPLLMSHDMRNVKAEFKEILLNKGAIAINQDKLGIPGQRKYKGGNIEIWTKPIEPVYKETTSWGIAVLSKRTDGSPHSISVPLKRIGLDGNKTYKFTEVFGAIEAFEVVAGDSLKVRIPPTSAFLFKVIPKVHKESEEAI